MRTSVNLEPVRAFPLSEEHRANNFADYLDEHGIEATILYGEVASVKEAEAVLVAVSPASAKHAADLTEAFLASYDASVDELISRRLKPSSGMRAWAAFYTFVLPALVVVYGLRSLWKALLWDPGSEAYLSSWRDRDLGIGIIALVVGLGYFAVVWVLRRRAA